MITQIDNQLYCSVHPKQRLEVSEIKTWQDAYVGRVRYLINPCPECEKEREALKEAVKVINSYS